MNNLLIAKALFFCVQMGGVGWNRFQTIFYLSHGLTATQVGQLKTIGLILKFFGEPFWCLVADLWNQKFVFSFCVLAQIFTMEILRWVDINFSSILFVKVLRTTTSPSNTFTTSVSFALTKGTSEGYGQQRMFGSIAWGLGAWMVGYLIDLFGFHSIFWYTYFFNVCTFCLVFFCIPSTLLNSKDSSSSISKLSSTSGGGGDAHAASSSSEALKKYLGNMLLFLKNKPCRILLTNAFLYGVVMVVPDSFLYISLEQDHHATRTFNGFCTALSTLSCIPCFYYSDRIIAACGHSRTIVFAQATLVLRLLALASVPAASDWTGSGFVSSMGLIALLQLVHGLNFALFWSASVDGIRRLAPVDLAASSMAVLNVSFFTLAGVLGNLVWGPLYDQLGVRSLYLLSAVALALVTVYLHASGGPALTAALGHGPAPLGDRV